MNNLVSLTLNISEELSMGFHQVLKSITTISIYASKKDAQSRLLIQIDVKKMIIRL